MGYITTLKVQQIRWYRRSKGLTIGTANGCFDLLHPSHVHFLRECKAELGPNSLLVVLVNDDRYCLKVKGPGRPIIPQEDRLKMVRSVKGVGLAFLFGDKDPGKWIRRIRPTMHFKGNDWEGKECPEAKYAPLHFIASDLTYTTSGLVERIQKGAQ